MTTPSAAPAATAGVSVGVVGGTWRGRVTPWGALVPADGSPTLDWWVAADDRWHSPSVEPTCRQRRIGGAPVLETAVRVPGGDAVQRIYAVGHDGGLTVVEIENCSPSPFAVVVSRRDVLTARPPATVPIKGVEVPACAISLPVAHRATVRLALSHDGRGAGTLPAGLPSADEVARGWAVQTSHAVRLVLPATDPEVVFVALRAELLLCGHGDADLDASAFLVGVAELARLGVTPERLLPEVAQAAEQLARRHRTDAALPWTADAGLAAAEEVFDGAGERRAAWDLRAARRRLPPVEATAVAPPDGVLGLAWAARRVTIDGRDAVDLFPAPFPEQWLGQEAEGYGLPTAHGRVGVALRWHAERPALLWEADVDRPLTCSGLDPSWSGAGRRGEALLSPVRRAPR